MKTQIYNSLRARNKAIRVIQISNSITLRISNDAGADDPAEMMLYDEIGRDPWSGTGITAADFKKALDSAKGRSLMLRINSMGGDVFEGMAIKSMLDEWPQKVTAKIDGIAASTASFIPMGCDSIVMAKGAQMFIHDAWGVCQGNAADMEKVASQLDSTSDLIAGMYADRNGKPVEKMRDLMRQESLFNAAECKKLGLCDDISNDSAVRNFTPEEISGMKAKLHASNNSASAKAASAGNQTTPQIQVMNRQEMLALLKAHGIAPADTETDAQLLERVKNMKPVAAAVATVPVGEQSPFKPEAIAKLEAQVAELTKAKNEVGELVIAAKKNRVTNRVEKLIAEDRLGAALKDDVISLAMENEKHLDIYEKQPAKPPGAENVATPTLRVENGESSFGELQRYMLALGPVFNARFLGAKAGNALDYHARQEMASNAATITNTYRKHRNKFIEMFNTNTIDSDLQRIVLLQEMLEEYVIGLLPLTAFSVVFANVPLEGTDKVGVPFYPLQTATANSWAAATGYASGSMSNSTTNIREVAVGGIDGSSGSSAAANTAKDRKWLGLQFDSYTLRRQPFFNAAKLVTQNANKLAVDIFTDVVSRVITNANYGAAVKTVPAAAFTADDVADLYGQATSVNWPMTNRSLVLNHTYNVNLLKDPTFKNYLAYGNTDPITKAVIRQAYGFENISVVPNLTNYSPAGENLVGWINHLYAMLVATSPIMPAPEVRNLLTRYDIVTDPKTGITFEYRQMANATLDQAQYIVECSYGAQLGVASSLKRITSA